MVIKGAVSPNKHRTGVRDTTEGRESERPVAKDMASPNRDRHDARGQDQLEYTYMGREPGTRKNQERGQLE